MHTTSGTTIDLGGINVQFLVEAQDSDGAATVFECAVAGGAMVPRPTAMTHSTKPSTASKASSPSRSTARPARSGPATRSASDAARSTSSPTPGRSTRSSSPSPLPASSGPTTSLQIRDVLTAAAGGPPDVGALLDVMRRHGLTPA